MRAVARRRSPCCGDVGLRRARAGSSPRPARPAPATGRTASSSSATTCGNASRKNRDPHRHVDPRPAELAQRHDLEAGHPPGRVVPDRPAAEQREHLGDVVALGAHRGRAPHGQPDRPRVRRRCRRGAAPAASRPAPTPTSQALRRRDRLGVDGVEVAPGRQHVDQPAGRRAGRPGRHVAAVQRVQHAVDLVGRCGPAAAPPRSAANRSTALDVRRPSAPSTSAHDRRRLRRRPSSASPSPSTSRRASSSSRSTRPRRCAPAVGQRGQRPRVAAATRLGQQRRSSRPYGRAAPRAAPAARARRPRPGARAAPPAPG